MEPTAKPAADSDALARAQESEARLLALVLQLLLRDSRRIARRLSALDAETPGGGTPPKP